MLSARAVLGLPLTLAAPTTKASQTGRFLLIIFVKDQNISVLLRPSLSFSSNHSIGSILLRQVLIFLSRPFLHFLRRIEGIVSQLKL